MVGGRHGRVGSGGTGKLESVLESPLLLLATGFGLAVLLVAAVVAIWMYRSRPRRVRKDNYFNEEFVGTVIPSRKLLKRRIGQIFPLMVAENPGWENYSEPGAWRIESSLEEDLQSDPLRTAIVYALFFDAAAYQRRLVNPVFTYPTMRGMISEALFLYRREFNWAEVDAAVKEAAAKELAEQQAKQDAPASRWG